MSKSWIPHQALAPRVLAVAAALVAGLLTPAAVEAAPRPTALSAAVAARAVEAPALRAGGKIRAAITFDRNFRWQFNSRIKWKVWREKSDGTRVVLERDEWRAGSGLRREGGKDECRKGTGWTPKGTYSFVQHNDYWGNVIQGRTFYLGEKRCYNGTERVDLFIHTESGRGNVQCKDAKGDQACRWEWPKINDYRSFGCIKMAPDDLQALTRAYHRYFDAGVRYPTSTVKVRVVP